MGYYIIMLYLKEPNSAPAASSLLKPTEESLDYHVSDHSNRYLVEPFEVNGSDSDSSSSGDDSSSNDESDSTDILDHDSFITAVNLPLIVILILLLHIIFDYFDYHIRLGSDSNKYLQF